MTKRRKGDRRELLLRSLELPGRGGFTTHGAKRMTAPLGGRPAECTLTKHCRTSIFEYPGSYLVEPADTQIVYSHDGTKVAIVSDLPAYFEQQPTE